MRVFISLRLKLDNADDDGGVVGADGVDVLASKFMATVWAIQKWVLREILMCLCRRLRTLNGTNGTNMLIVQWSKQNTSISPFICA